MVYLRVNETIAHMANKIDELQGSFWEGREKSMLYLGENLHLQC